MNSNSMISMSMCMSYLLINVKYGFSFTLLYTLKSFIACYNDIEGT